jgi:radical SAM protein with 4Fe4S-binding SPASM domain
MFYVKSDEEILEAIDMETSFGQIMPYFDTPDFRDATKVELVEMAVIQDDGNFLLFNPMTATWCFVDDDEWRICRSMRGQTRFADLRNIARGCSDDSLKEFLSHLYRRGLLKVEGKAGIDQHIYANGPLFHKQYLVELLITEGCNLACEYCFANAHRRGDTMPLEIGRRAIEKAFALPGDKLIIEFAGGETFTQFGTFVKLVEYIEAAVKRSDKTVEIVAQSNGTLFRKHKIIRFLDRHRVRVGISLDGPPEINDKTKHFPDGESSYAHTLRGVERLRHYGLKEVPLLTVVTKHNVHRAASVLDHFSALGMYHVMFNPILPRGRAGLRWDDLGITGEQYFEFMKEVLDYHENGRGFEDLNLARMMRNLMRRTRDFRCFRSPCGAGFDYFSIDPRGDIYPCAHHVDKPELRMGNVADPEDLNVYVFKNRIVQEMKMKRIVANIPECRECTWRHLCEGGCSLDTYAEYGTLYHSTPMCEYYKLMYPYLLTRIVRRPEVILNCLPDAAVTQFSLRTVEHVLR